MKPAACHIFVLGDVHGHHQKAIRLVEDAARERGVSIDLILQVGDFNVSMSEADAASIPCPQKYRGAGDFARYHERYPAEVVFIGGNHEPARITAAIPNGGLVAPRVHYLGRAGVVERFGLRIAGVSGNYSPVWFRRPIAPLDVEPYANKKQMLYTREPDVERLLAEPPVDILLMHTWPRSLWAGTGGSQRNPAGVGYAEGDLLLEHLRPRYCFLGHMHVFLRARIGGTDCIAFRQVNPAPGDTWPSAESIAVLRWDGAGLVLI